MHMGRDLERDDNAMAVEDYGGEYEDDSVGFDDGASFELTPNANQRWFRSDFWLYLGFI